MNFIEAVKAMKEGKKVRRPLFKEHPSIGYIYKNGDYILRGDAGEFPMGFENLEATDWEIIEEKKTLSDKIGTRLPYGWIFTKDGTELKVQHVKEAIEKLMDYYEELNTVPIEQTALYEKAKELFGERLLETSCNKCGGLYD